MEYSKPLICIVRKERTQKRSQFDRRKRQEKIFFAIKMTVFVESLFKLKG